MDEVKIEITSLIAPGGRQNPLLGIASAVRMTR
jgi:hypothetical protein